MREVSGSVPFGVSREVAFDYLVDPRHRTEWQSSLRAVSAIDGEPRVGQTWVDETKPGIDPRMRTTELTRPSRWSETGRWRFVRADLTLVFAEAPGGCVVDYRFRIRLLGPVGLALSALSRPAVGADLRRAAAILSSRS
ncbi:MAG TPA: SRPBCC family protein [Nocardioides sp.]|uniref:SRPBCC family protein n=1 Tax=uncultured Nocardioides sp. TaxID=198441 RepID=UPI000EBD2DC5|nr:SRPBCC family protein [uncultured Nocardioides sp.]HCB04800.1 polyketide cyclase [Nocardioides sp.]HRD61145.1 SRPBCC family protein [Nocardioides sp.]HRI96317.1 SRPBCC family protein [Nocardioides sp.]HRK44717.1 SRPBCC family protein [Nocardioides sp.]